MRGSALQVGLSGDLINTPRLTPMTRLPRLPLASCLRPVAVITALHCVSLWCLSQIGLPPFMARLPVYVCVCFCIYVNQPSSFSGGCSARKGYQNITVHWERGDERLHRARAEGRFILHCVKRTSSLTDLFCLQIHFLCVTLTGTRSLCHVRFLIKLWTNKQQPENSSQVVVLTPCYQN